MILEDYVHCLKEMGPHYNFTSHILHIELKSRNFFVIFVLEAN